MLNDVHWWIYIYSVYTGWMVGLNLCIFIYYICPCFFIYNKVDYMHTCMSTWFLYTVLCVCVCASWTRILHESISPSLPQLFWPWFYVLLHVDLLQHADHGIASIQPKLRLMTSRRAWKPACLKIGWLVEPSGYFPSRARDPADGIWVHFWST